MYFKLDGLDATNHDWASWDDMYEFAETRSPAFVKSNIVDGMFQALGVGVMVLVNESGEVVLAEGRDLQTGEAIDVAPDLLAHVSAGSRVFERGLAGEGVSGLLSLASGPMLVSARPVLTSEEAGPPRGVLLMAAYLDGAVLDAISGITGVPVKFAALRESPSTIAGADLAHTGGVTGEAITPLSSGLIEGSAAIHDVYGETVVRVSITREREIYAEGQRTLGFFLAITMVGGLALAVATLILADRALFRRLSRLATEVRSIGENSDFSGEVSVNGDDEISFLAGTINETLSTLAQTHRQVRDSHSELERTTAELKRAQHELGTTANRLRRLTRHLQAMREDERALVANEIHDHVGQGLTALKMDVASLEKASLRGEAPAPQFLQKMNDVVNSLLDTVRRLSSGLRPSMLEDLGLAEAFEWHLTEFEKGRAIHTTLRIQGPVGSVESGRGLTLFRILQEALLVSAEDSSVTEVSVALTIENRYALLAVQDNGTGTMVDDALSRREMGLSLIRERVEVFGGGVTIASAPGTGTTVVAQVPL